MKAIATHPTTDSLWTAGQEVLDYWVDAGQRWLLFLDVLGERAARYNEHANRPAPHVLSFQCTLVMDGPGP